MSLQYSSDIVYHLKKVVANNLINDVFITIKKNHLTQEDIKIIKILINLCTRKDIQLVFCGSKNTINRLEKLV